MTPSDLETVCSLLEQHAPKLRDAGVLELELGDLWIKLAEPVPAEPSERREVDEEPIDPLDDGDTYPSGRTPGYQRRRRGDDA